MEATSAPPPFPALKHGLRSPSNGDVNVPPHGGAIMHSQQLHVEALELAPTRTYVGTDLKGREGSENRRKGEVHRGRRKKKERRKRRRGKGKATRNPRPSEHEGGKTRNRKSREKSEGREDGWRREEGICRERGWPFVISYRWPQSQTGSGEVAGEFCSPRRTMCGGGEGDRRSAVHPTHGR